MKTEKNVQSKTPIKDEGIHKTSKGLDDWNDRLDENLESNEHNDPEADERAEDFSKENGSGDQSD